MAERKKKKGNGILFGLILMGISIMGIWKNEHRFDYFKAARDTAPVETVGSLAPGTLFSHTGGMDQSLRLKGKYVQSFEGYLEIDRVAEIYAWDRDEDDEGVTWTREWMSYLQNNERNEGLKKRFKSDTIAPPTYQVGDLRVQSENMQLVDSSQAIPPLELKLTERGVKQGLVLGDGYFYLAKGDPDQLGDERISYRGIPIPAVATYFGKWGEGVGVAHQAEVKEGFISGIIQDKGLLHHLVAGPREIALTTIKKHLARLKMIVRIVGFVLCTIGGGILFSSLTRLLVFIPIVGPFINQVTGWIGLLVGLLVGIITLILAYLTSKPLILAAFAVVLVVALVFLGKNATRKRKRLQESVANTLGHTPSSAELKELEFIQLWQLASSNGAVTPDEQTRLDKLTRKNGWSPVKVTELTHRAEQERAHTNDQQKLETLIRYSLADGRIDRKELKTLQSAASWIGVNKKDLRALMTRVQAV